MQQWHTTTREDGPAYVLRCCCVPIAHEIMDNKTRKSNQARAPPAAVAVACLLQYAEKAIPCTSTATSERWSKVGFPLDRLEKLEIGNVRRRVRSTSQAHMSSAQPTALENSRIRPTRRARCSPKLTADAALGSK